MKCANISNGLRITTNGKFTPCCIASTAYFKDENGDDMSVLNTSIGDVLKSPTLKKLREDFENDIKSPECKGCWDLEKSGVESKRIRDNKRVEHVPLQENDLYFLELNLGNICNLSCRICNIYASSNWKKEHKTILNPNTSDDELNEILKSHSLPFSDESMVWGEVEKTMSSVKILDLYGGEPMLMKKQWSVLERSVQNGTSKEKYVHFNTNGTIFKKDYLELLSNFECADISFSIDGLGDKFNYQRHGANWGDTKTNILLWLDGVKKYNNFKFHICFTISIMNVIDFAEVAEFAIENGIRIHCNFLSEPKYYSITNIPEDRKVVIGEHIKKTHQNISKIKDNLDEQFNSITQYLFNEKCVEEEWNSFIRINHLLDKSRDQKFKDVFPETYKILGL